MSEIGSVSIGSPARFGHAGDHAEMRELAQADPAEAELLVHGTRPAAAVAAGVRAGLEALRARSLRDHRLLGHQAVLPSRSANGRPSPRSSANACSSVSAVVVIV